MWQRLTSRVSLQFKKTSKIENIDSFRGLIEKFGLLFLSPTDENYNLHIY